MSSDDMIQDFAPALRTNSQAEAFRIALQMLGDLCGFGISYFDFDDSRGYVKTATEVSSDNSALMRNIARHEHALEVSLAGISRAVMQVSRGFGVTIPDEGEVRVEFDDSIIQDTAALKWARGVFGAAGMLAGRVGCVWRVVGAQAFGLRTTTAT